MVLTFEKNKRAYVSDLNNLAMMNLNAVRNDTQVIAHSPADMGVRVLAGNVFFGTLIIPVTQQDLVIGASHPSFDRIDLIVVDSTGTASVIAGYPEAEPHTPTYDPLTYVVLARVFVDDLSTTVPSSKISDLRIINEAVGTFGKYVESGIIGQTTVTITHNLNELDPVVACYEDSTNNLILPSNVTILTANQLQVTFTPAFTGRVVIQGGSGGSGGGGGADTYIHAQPVSATVWNVVHNLGQQIVNVQCFDSTDTWIQPHSIVLNTANSCTVTFLSAESGKAIVKK